MPPKKKLKSGLNKVLNEENKSDSGENELLVLRNGTVVRPAESNTAYQSIRLSLLPVDVLLHIYKYLTTADFVSLSQLGEPILRELVDVQRIVNFSICRRTSFELMSSYFTRERVKHITKLSFSFYIFAKSPDLVQIICRCKNLTVLSIIECGIQYKQMLKVLQNCSALRELSWNCTEIILPKDKVYRSSVTKLFLFCGAPDRQISTAFRIVKNFPKIENAIVCFSQDSLMMPPYITSWSKSLSLLSKDNSRWITVIKDFLVDNRDGMILQAVIGMNRELNEMWNVASYPLEDIGKYTSACYNQPPFLKVKTCEQDISLLSSCGSNIYQSAIIFLTISTPCIYENFFQCISKVVGCDLKHLSIECNDPDLSADRRPTNVMPKELYDNISSMLGTLLLSCKNITVLNFGTIHFTSGSPFKAMCDLQNLKILNIPTCAFPKAYSNSTGLSNEHSQDQCSFEELVSKCWKVDEFHLVCCNLDKGSMEDSEIYPIQSWKRLISFSIYSVIFRKCRFLRKIAMFCPTFQSFSLIGTAPDSGCIYYSDVIYLLKTAKNLSFIRINDRYFNPLFGTFLNAVSSAENLEGICFMTDVTTPFNTPPFIRSIQSLKYLHLFHFSAPRVSYTLFQEVKKSMDRNGIKNIKIENDCLGPFTLFQGLESQILELQGTKFFHLRPLLHCRHLHLKNFHFDFFPFFNKKET